MKSWFSLRRSEPIVDEPLPTGDASGTLSDDELLRQFVVERDDRAFAQLVGRHSGMVMGVCRRVLGFQHDAEDAFQAVFLVLARKADSLRCGGSLPAWLHKTAFRTALRARSERVRRREQAVEDFEMIALDSFAEIASDHDATIVDEELNHLSERYRLPLFLCCVEGKSLDVAARQLGWSVGSVKGRLERGRNELRRRLLLRRSSVALGLAALAAMAPAAQASTVFVSPSLIAATTQAGMQYAVGHSALGYVSQNALHLAHGSWKIMSLTALKITVCSVTLAGLAVFGSSRLPSPAVADGTGSGGIVLEASLPSTPASFEMQLALADEREGAPKTGAREGDAPRTGPREGDKPRTGPREGDQPRTGVREGETPRTGAREGDKPRTAEGGAVAGQRTQLNDFQPQTPREKALYEMILQMQRELSDLRRIVQTREGGATPRGVEGAPRVGPRDGEGTKTGPRDGERPSTGPRDGDKPRTGPRDGDAPKKPAARDGDAPKKE